MPSDSFSTLKIALIPPAMNARIKLERIFLLISRTEVGL